MEKEMLTAREVAAYLNINEKMVYRLVREARLPGTQITGKWTFSRPLIRNWVESQSLHKLKVPHPAPHPSSLPSHNLFIAGSNDLIMERMQTHLLKGFSPGIVTYMANTGSLGGLRALHLGRAHMAGVHLYHPQSKEYNIPYLKDFVPEEEVLVFHLACRNQGFILNPHRSAFFEGVGDLASSDMRLVNREPGSGTRLLLDHLLAEEGISPRKVRGYPHEVFTHMEVGLAVLRGEADVGLGIQPVAERLHLKFLPITTERYDLVVPKENLSIKSVQVFLNLLHSARFSKLAGDLVGYDLKDSGKMVH